MILITVRTKVKPDNADAYLEADRPFLEATRQEPGNKWYEAPDIIYVEIPDRDGWDTVAEF